MPAYDLTMPEDADLDIPFGGCADSIVIVLADAFDEDPLPWFEKVMVRGEIEYKTDQLLADLLSIDLETSTQLPHIAEGIRRWMLDRADSADREMGSPPY